MGKRATLWLQDFLLDFEQVESLIHRLPLRGVKGTTGTQASFLELLEGDHDKVRALDRRVCELMGFQKSIPVRLVSGVVAVSFVSGLRDLPIACLCAQE